MANPDTLRITYHPAKRSIYFEVRDGKTPINEIQYETLDKYALRQKGSFILNLCGNSFFEDILKPFSGKDEVSVSMRTTRLDYEDFKRRVEEYNKISKDTKITLLPLNECDELADMRTAFNAIKEQGENIVSLLDSHWNAIQNIPCMTNNAKEYLMKIAEKIKTEKDHINKELKALTTDTNVNLCVIGVHSSGKSTLINTLIGYRILPESIRPETAKMMRITGVPDRESSYIKFSKGKSECKLTWDKSRACLTINDSNIPEDFISKLQGELDKNHELRLDVQFNRILTYLNDDTSIKVKIDLGFPLPINSEELQFTIYDTPGSDSNNDYHKRILREALASQNNAILLFVLSPNNVSGGGNIDLMKDLLRSSQRSDSFIDIEQSFFVYNYADASNTSLDELKAVKLTGNQDTKPVDLAERKVFFVSAICAFAAMAQKNGVADIPEIKTFKYKCAESYDEDIGRYYRHNHHGKSEYATKSMLEKSDKTLTEAKDDCSKYFISSGVYTLVDELKSYGERYAATVKTSALIKSIESAVTSVAKIAEGTRVGTDEKVRDIQAQLEDEIEKVHDIIDSTSVEYTSRFQNFREAEEELNDVGVGSKSFFYNVLQPVREVLDKRLQKYLGVFSVHIDEKMKQEIQSDISEIYRKYTENYKMKRADSLQKKQTDFIENFMMRVEKSELSKETKEKLNAFKLPDIPEFELDKKIDELFNSAKLFEHETIKKIFAALAVGTTIASEKMENSIKTEEQPSESFFKNGFENSKKAVNTALKTFDKFAHNMNEKIDSWNTRTVNKEQFITEVTNWFHKNQGDITDKFRNDFSESVSQMCSDLSEEFRTNIDLYSTKIRALREENEPLEKLADNIAELETALSDKKVALDSKI